MFNSVVAVKLVNPIYIVSVRLIVQPTSLTDAPLLPFLLKNYLIAENVKNFFYIFVFNRISD